MTLAELLKLMGVKADPKKSELEAEDLVDLFSAALEGSTWCGVDNSGDEYRDPAYKSDCFEGRMAKILMGGRSLHFYDMEEEDGPWELTLDMLDKGAGVFFSRYDHLVREVIREDGFDAETADALFQCCLLGEIVYG